MEPEAGNSLEVEGVLNPATIPAPMGSFISSRDWCSKQLFANRIARVSFNDDGDPHGVNA